jgi:hypothetical protein
MDEQQRQEISERNRRRARSCPRCGSPEVDDRDDLDDEVHFPGVWYRVCRACGADTVLKRKSRRGGTP